MASSTDEARAWARENPDHVVLLALLAFAAVVTGLGVKEAGIAVITGVLGYLKGRDEGSRTEL